MTGILPIVLGAFGAAVGWVILHFVGKPFRSFFDLRTEASNVIALYNGDMFGVRSHEARDNYKKTGAKLVAFDNSEPLAPTIIRLMGFDPRVAGKTMLTIASDWGDVMKGNAVKRASEGVKLALKLSDESKLEARQCHAKRQSKTIKSNPSGSSKPPKRSARTTPKL